MPSKIKIQTGSASDTGLVRSENQDRCEAFEILRHGIYGIVIADGMGGHFGGGFAAEIAVRHFISYMQNTQPKAFTVQKDIPGLLQNAFDQVSTELAAHAGHKPEHQGMGTTLSAALVIDRQLFTAHIGDSRIYRFNRKSRMQISRDHSMVQEMVNQGLLTPEQARNHPDDNVLIRALTAKNCDNPDIYAPLKVNRGDVFLVCSDGLWKMVSDKVIHETVIDTDAQQAANELVELANTEGGEDNISVSILRVL